jgi:L-ascorbate metabolism protein UlaG (beta-lactamase superfamily)
VAVKIDYLGHSCFAIAGGGKRLIIDPFLTGNPQAAVAAGDVKVDYVLVSHAHGDHLGDTVPIAKRTGATAIACHEIATWLQGQGVTAHGMHIGGGFDFPFGRVKLTIAHHGSSFADGSYGGNPCGFLLTIEGRRIYHACDTGLFYDMKLIGDVGLDLAILPIGDNFTMGPDDALVAVELLRPQRVWPIHYDTFPVIAQDVAAFAAQVHSRTSAECLVLPSGSTLEL